MPAKKQTVTAAKRAKNSGTSSAAQNPASEATDTGDRDLMVSEAAYFRALERGFEGGSADEDWYAAEADIRRMFREM